MRYIAPFRFPARHRSPLLADGEGVVEFGKGETVGIELKRGGLLLHGMDGWVTHARKEPHGTGILTQEVTTTSDYSFNNGKATSAMDPQHSIVMRLATAFIRSFIYSSRAGVNSSQEEQQTLALFTMGPHYWSKLNTLP